MENERTRYRPNALRWFNKLLRWTYGAFLAHRFHVRTVGNDLFKRLKPPYVLVPNHQSEIDPFIVNYFVPEPVYWVTGDGNMRSSIMKGVLSLVGSIPKSKAIPDLSTVNWIVDVIRKRRGVVGIFPEGQASWDGHTLPLIPSTAKLLKLLKVPVVVAILKGAYHSKPRWSWLPRPSDIEIEYRLLMDGDEAKASSAEDILARLEAALEFDEEAWRATHPRNHAMPRLARHLELALFMCPVCGSMGSMRSYRTRFFCRSCGHVVRLRPDYRFASVGASEARFATIRDWNLWQAGAFGAAMAAALSSPEKPLFSDGGVMLLRGRKMNPLRRFRTGLMILYADRIEFTTLFGQRMAFPFDQIEGEGVLKQQVFEFYLKGTLYQFRFPRRFQSARKWHMAVEAFKSLTAAPPSSGT